MADMDYYGADYGAEGSSRFIEAARNFGLVNWAGAATSLGLSCAMAVWAVDLTFRDVSGVPVIRAMEGPMRVAPENPGGKVAPFQGLALSDITSGGAAAPAPEQIVLAPPPVELEAPALGERRQAMAALAAPEPAPAVTPAPAAAVAAAPATPMPDGDFGRSAPSGATTLAELRDGEVDVLADKLAGGAEGIELASASTDTQIEPMTLGDVPATAELVVASLAQPGVAISTRPRMRPAALARRPAVAEPGVARSAIAQAVAAAQVPTEAPAQAPGTQVASTSNEVITSRDVDPASVPAGTRVVQLGAFDSEAIARSEWERLSARFSTYMDGKGRMIQKARSGGRDFWRLRVVGFEDGSDARRFCSALLAQNAACMPVTMR